MKQIYKHINEEDFCKYLNNQMTSAERNLFERELQKYPFETEALEGFLNINPIRFQKDLNKLKNKIHQKKHNNNYRYWAAAASILLIVASGLIWVQLNMKSPMPQITEYKIRQNQKEKSTIPSFQKELVPENEILQPQQLEKNIPTEQKKDENINKVIPQHKGVKGVLKSAPLNVSKTTVGEKKMIAQNVIEHDINLKEIEVEPTRKAVAARNISQPKDLDVLFKVEGVQNENNIKPSTSEIVSFNTVRANEDFADSHAVAPAGKALPEMAAPKSASKMRTAILADSKAQPEIGMSEFKKYLKNEAILPNNYPKRKEPVKLLLEINASGEITKFQNQNSADSLLFEQAKRIIQDGSKWQPEIKNGVSVESEIEIKIVFRK